MWGRHSVGEPASTQAYSLLERKAGRLTGLPPRLAAPRLQQGVVVELTACPARSPFTKFLPPSAGG
jgi:hypothetical protein